MAEIAWLDCPYGNVNDPYPGQCELYTDTNSNQICDHSEPPLSPMKSFVLWASFVVVALYFLHWYLSHKTTIGKRFKFLSRVWFRYFWNLVLLLSFIPAAVSGVLWVFGVTSFDFNLWHNKAGIIFTIVVALHLLKRFRHILNFPRW